MVDNLGVSVCVFLGGHVFWLRIPPMALKCDRVCSAGGTPWRCLLTEYGWRPVSRVCFWLEVQGCISSWVPCWVGGAELSGCAFEGRDRVSSTTVFSALRRKSGQEETSTNICQRTICGKGISVTGFLGGFLSIRMSKDVTTCESLILTTLSSPACLMAVAPFGCVCGPVVTTC